MDVIYLMVENDVGIESEQENQQKPVSDVRLNIDVRL